MLVFLLQGYFKGAIQVILYVQFCILLFKNLPNLIGIFHYLCIFWISFLEWSPRNEISESYRVLLDTK